MKERLENAARRWCESGRASHLLLGEKEFFAAQCWLNAHQIYPPESTATFQEINDFVLACKAAIGGEAGWNAMLNERTLLLRLWHELPPGKHRDMHRLYAMRLRVVSRNAQWLRRRSGGIAEDRSFGAQTA